VAQQGLTFGRLEPCEGKLSSTVLRGLGAGNSPRLPGRYQPKYIHINNCGKDTPLIIIS